MLNSLKAEISSHKNYKNLDQKSWKEKIAYRDITKRSQKDFDWYKKMYPKKIESIRQELRETGIEVKVIPQYADGKMKTTAEIVDEMNEQMERVNYLVAKEERLLDKLAVVLKEEQLRKDNLVTRVDIHDAADYYIDYDSGIDSADGRKQGNFNADAGTNTTTIVDAELDGLTITDNAASSGDFVWNVTREEGSYIDSWDDGTDTIVLTSSITGQTTGDEYYIISAWKTIHQYTTVTSRSPGDRAFLRANVTWDYGDGGEARTIPMDEDGNSNNWIKIIGCDSTVNDPWFDGSDVQAKIDFDGTTRYFDLTTDEYWWFENLDITNGNSYRGLIYYGGLSLRAKIKDCTIHNNSYASDSKYGGGITLGSSCFYEIEGCSFYDLRMSSLNLTGAGACLVKDCIFNGGASTTDHGIKITNGSIYIESCTFGVTTSHDSSDLYDGGWPNWRNIRAFVRNCIFTSNPPVSQSSYGAGFISNFFFEDLDGVYGSHSAYLGSGDVTKETTDARSGGADSYARLYPSSTVGLNNTFCLGDLWDGFAQIWLTKDAEYTVTVYARTGSAWDSALSASEAFLRASYLSNGSTAVRTEIDSTETITNDAAWTAFTVTFTPLQTGFAYFWFYLAEYEDASEYIDVDILPVVS